MLYNFGIPNFNYQRQIKQQHRDSLTNVIDRGIELMGSSSLDENMFLTWKKYSVDILSLIAKDNPIPLSNYYSFMLNIPMYDSTYDKLKKSVNYLIELLKII